MKKTLLLLLICSPLIVMSESDEDKKSRFKKCKSDSKLAKHCTKQIIKLKTSEEAKKSGILSGNVLQIKDGFLYLGDKGLLLHLNNDGKLYKLIYPSYEKKRAHKISITDDDIIPSDLRNFENHIFKINNRFYNISNDKGVLTANLISKKEIEAMLESDEKILRENQRTESVCNDKKVCLIKNMENYCTETSQLITLIRDMTAAELEKITDGEEKDQFRSSVLKACKKLEDILPVAIPEEVKSEKQEEQTEKSTDA